MLLNCISYCTNVVKVLVMVERSVRLSQFLSDRLPAVGNKVQLLCEDHVGTYTLPFLCCWTDSGWKNAATLTTLEVEVVGWREPPSKLR